MKYLADLATLPYVTASGRIVTKPGYDDDTSIYLHMPHDWQPLIPRSPSPNSVRDALATMMRPWRAYSWASPDDAAAMVSAVLAAVARPSLGLCPAYLFGAAQQGSGKTLAACAIGALMTGDRPAVTPYAATKDYDDELRKRLVSTAMDGVRFTCLDNVTGHLKSSALAAVLTSGSVNDRVLGQSRTITARVRALLTMSANNLSVDADLQRRIVSVRIEAGEMPARRSFAFDPVSEALKLRREIVEAALIVLRAYFGAGAPDVVAGDAGGFADWNRLVRQPVLWLTREGLADALGSQLRDPAASMLADPADTDPEIEALADLLRALWALSQGDPFTSAQALEWVVAGDGDREGALGLLRAAVVELVGRADLSAKSLGRALMYRRDRPVDGLKLLASGGRMKSWRVVSTSRPSDLSPRRFAL